MNRFHISKENKLAASIAAAITTLATFGPLLMFLASPESSLANVAAYGFAIGFPGELVGSIVAGGPDGGGTPLNYLLVIIPFNFLFYWCLSLAVIKAVNKLRGRPMA